jgi:hypothetical protein
VSDSRKNKEFVKEAVLKGHFVTGSGMVNGQPFENQMNIFVRFSNGH